MPTQFRADNIEIIDALDPDQKADVEQIIKTLSSTEKTLKHGEKFTGRPSTRIFTDDDYLVKFKSEYNFRVVEARRWIRKTIDQERCFNIYHPGKTWFIIHTDEGGVIANITTALTPLHTTLETMDAATLQKHLLNIFSWYFEIVRNFDKRMDEGLSNFAVDKDNHLYYIDDDMYNWDEFTALSSAINILFLKITQLSTEQWKFIGEHIRLLILEHLKDSHWIPVLIELLKGGFSANDHQQECRAQLIMGLNNRELPQAKHTQLEHLFSQSHQEQPTTETGPDLIAIMADIHANYPALEVVLEQLKMMNIRNGLILGDVVGYGPHPQQCIEAIRGTNYICIKGNHDHGIATGNISRGFSNTALWVVNWSREQLTKEHFSWLDALPPYVRHDNWLALHGAPKDKTFFNAYIYRMTYEDNLDNLEERDIKICFHGHTHLPSVYYREKNGDQLSTDSRFDTSDTHASLVCPGSIGKTRSQIPGAEFALFNIKSGEITFHRIEYDLEKTLHDMRRYNFPAQLLERLQGGQ